MQIDALLQFFKPRYKHIFDMKLLDRYVERVVIDREVRVAYKEDRSVENSRSKTGNLYM